MGCGALYWYGRAPLVVAIPILIVCFVLLDRLRMRSVVRCSTIQRLKWFLIMEEQMILGTAGKSRILDVVKLANRIPWKNEVTLPGYDPALDTVLFLLAGVEALETDEEK